jgi:hypothetical protein
MLAAPGTVPKRDGPEFGYRGQMECLLTKSISTAIPAATEGVVCMKSGNNPSIPGLRDSKRLWFSRRGIVGAEAFGVELAKEVRKSGNPIS